MTWVAIAFFLGALLVEHGNVFPDEGWYLYAGQLVADGKVPYRDFAFFQAPLSAYLFGFAHGDLETGRWISLFFGLGAIGFALDIARRRGRDVFVAAAVLLVPATYTLRWYAVVRNIAPAAFFLTLGVWLVDVGMSVAVAALAMALAAGFRLSAAGGLAALVLSEAYAGRWTRAAVAGVSGALGLLAVLGSFGMLAPESAWFGMLAYHTGLPAEASKVQGLLRLADHHHLLFVALSLAFLKLRRVPALPGLTVLCVTVLHLVPGRLHPEYHELVMPLMAVVAACMWPELAPLRWWRRPRWVQVGLAGLVVAQLLGARGQLHHVKGWSPRMIEEVGAELERVGLEGQPVLTFVPDFALAADMPLMSGLEMGSVSIAVPMEAARAKALKVVTLEMLREALCLRHPGTVVWRSLEDADARRVGLYGGRCVAELEAALRAGYEPVGERHGWTIWRRRPA